MIYWDTMHSKDPLTLRTAPYVDASTWTYFAVRLRAPKYGDVWHRTSTQDTADAKLYATYRCYVNGHNCVAVRHRRQCNATCMHVASVDVPRRSVCVNAAAEINVLDYKVAVHVRQRTA